jgi:hypothetical protein
MKNYVVGILSMFENTAKLFLENFKDLIITAKPLM